MNDPFAPIVEIIRARNTIAYPFDKTDVQLLDACFTLLKYSDNAIDHKDARNMRAQITFNAQERQAEALQGFDLYVQPVTTPASGWVAMAAACGAFTIVGYIIGAVTQ